jgi:hypothetical protein
VDRRQHPEHSEQPQRLAMLHQQQPRQQEHHLQLQLQQVALPHLQLHQHKTLEVQPPQQPQDVQQQPLQQQQRHLVV